MTQRVSKPNRIISSVKYSGWWDGLSLSNVLLGDMFYVAFKHHIRSIEFRLLSLQNPSAIISSTQNQNLGLQLSFKITRAWGWNWESPSNYVLGSNSDSFYIQQLYYFYWPWAFMVKTIHELLFTVIMPLLSKVSPVKFCGERRFFSFFGQKNECFSFRGVYLRECPVLLLFFN